MSETHGQFMTEHRTRVEQRADGKWVAVDEYLFMDEWSPLSETRGYRREATAQRKATRRLKFWTDLERHRTVVVARPPLDG